MKKPVIVFPSKRLRDKDGPVPDEPRRVSIRLPRPLWIGLVATVVALGYAGVYWWVFRPGPTFEIGGIKYALDIERALVRARFQNKPVLLFFSAVNSEGCRRMEQGVLRRPSTGRRLDQFVCAAAFVDQVPFVDAKVGKEMGDRNSKLEEDLLEDVALPSFAVVRPDFDAASPSDRQKLIAVSIGLVDDYEFNTFLDAALARWDETRQSVVPGQR
jgi:hypothetical protein